MSEEDIKELEIHTKNIIEEGLDSDDNIQSMLQKWLELYQKEKEKNEELLNEKLEVKISVSAHNQIRQLQNELQQEKEKNKELQYKLEVEKIDNKYNQEERDEETIPRYKIIELLKEIQKEKDKATKHILEKDYQLAENGAIAQELGWVEGKIQSLLEEN